MIVYIFPGRGSDKTGSPQFTKEITSELGCITPWIIVPGKYTKDELNRLATETAGYVGKHKLQKLLVLVWCCLLATSHVIVVVDLSGMLSVLLSVVSAVLSTSFSVHGCGFCS